MIQQSKILIIVAHPDDEVLGCGGTIARLAKEGHYIYLVILGEGITSRYSQRERADRSLIELLHNSSRKVSELLGIREIFIHNFPDNRFDTIPLLEVIKLIEQFIERLQPDTIYTHGANDLNIDHVIVHRAVLTASRPVQGCFIKRLYTFEVPSSTEWAFGQFQPMFRPNVFVDINTTLPIKIAAMELYESEGRRFPHPRSTKALQAIASRWGSVVGLEAAEAFELIRDVR